MDDRTRLGAALAGTVGLFLCIQLGALALLDPYVAADAQPVDDPSNAGNVLYFFGVILVATGAMLVAIKFDLDVLLRGFVLLSCGWISWLVLQTVLRPLEDASVGNAALQEAVRLLPVLIPIAAGLVLVAALWWYPEWYVIDSAGVILGAGAAGLFGLAFTPQLTIAFLVVLAVYDAISVYGTEHMLALAEGVSEYNLPVLLVVPTTLSFSMLDDEGPESLEHSSSSQTDGGDSLSEAAVETAPSTADGEATVDAEADDQPESPGENIKDGDDELRNALYIGLGDAVMPTILAVSAAYFLREEAPLFDVPLLAVNLPAVTSIVGTLAGLLVLLWLVLKGRPHAGLPLLNGGAIGGYLVGALLSGVSLAAALGLPL